MGEVDHLILVIVKTVKCVMVLLLPDFSSWVWVLLFIELHSSLQRYYSSVFDVIHLCVAASDKESNKASGVWPPGWRRCSRSRLFQADWLGENWEQRSPAPFQTQNCKTSESTRALTLICTHFSQSLHQYIVIELQHLYIVIELKQLKD
jgi:hypothetical protein